ncbi:MAG: Hsp33 family molecular chaperone [Rhizobiales bacterium]|nr:Hsp33 family molecular chaperone [Hyphomicrobiales bacterium]
MTPIADDLVLPFEIKPLGVRGRLVRLGATVNQILQVHDYPPAVSALVAEAAALTSMLGSALKFDGKFILQTKSDGPIDMLVADYHGPGQVRAYAHFDANALHSVPGRNEAALLGAGHLAMTVDQGPDMERYQGIVPLARTTLSDAAHAYFAQSEQIPTRLRVAAGPLIGRGREAQQNWRAGAIMVQHLPRQGGPSPMRLSSGDAPQGGEEPLAENDDWVKARALLDTVEDHELLDPTLSPEDLLYRLYHEDGVTVYPATPISRYCTCSRERIGEILKQFSDEEIAEMREDGRIKVTCEFCSTTYEFEDVKP